MKFESFNERGNKGHHRGGGRGREERHQAPGRHREEHQRGGHGRRGGDKDQPGGAKTFRRGRAVAFLEMLEVKRATLKQQLETPELQTIQPILVGELKALEGIISEFVQLFELQGEQQALHEADSGDPSEVQADDDENSDKDNEDNTPE